MPERLQLRPILADADAYSLAAELAPAFGGDLEPAREILEQTVDLLTRDPRPDPWGSYLASTDDATVGICVCKAAPDAHGTVEIAYMTFPAFEGRGHATAMASALVEIARAAGAPLTIAHTLPEENASNRALKRNGFAFAGDVMDPEDGPVWRWEKRLG
jgi:[ribosomal protein S5]-alanine N-acetyltransferase